LNGTIPDAIGDLTALYELYLSANKIKGSLPQSMASLTAMQDLNVAQNRLTGTLGESLFAEMTDLKSLWLVRFDLCDYW